MNSNIIECSLINLPFMHPTYRKLVPCTALLVAACTALFIAGCLDAEFGARNRSGISIYLTPPTGTLQSAASLAGLLLMTCASWMFSKGRLGLHHILKASIALSACLAFSSIGSNDLGKRLHFDSSSLARRLHLKFDQIPEIGSRVRIKLDASGHKIRRHTEVTGTVVLWNATAKRAHVELDSGMEIDAEPADFDYIWDYSDRVRNQKEGRRLIELLDWRQFLDRFSVLKKLDVPTEFRKRGQANHKNHKLCLLVPFRDACPRYSRSRIGERSEHLSTFKTYMQTFLQRAGHEIFDILVIEQSARGHFNKGVLYNVGASVAERRGCDYVALHDVDYLPLHANNTYEWPSQPIHLCTNTSEVECCFDFAGGAVLMTLAHYAAINGMSNNYYGWGGEDSDLYYRVIRLWGSFERLGSEQGHYKSLGHERNDSTQEKTHARNLELVKRLYESPGRSTLDADGYSWTNRFAVVQEIRADRNIVTATVEVLRHGAQQQLCG